MADAIDRRRGPVGFVGIGAMGRPMAGHLLAAGYDVIVNDADAGRAAAFAQEIGGRAVATPRELGPLADTIVTMLPNSGIVGDVLFGSGCLAGSLHSGSLLLEMSSGAPQQTVEIGRQLAGHGVGMIDAPVSGGVSRAVTGELAIMVGGEENLVARAMPLLEAMGSTVTHTGALGTAHAMKALNNLVSAAGLLVSVEALLIGRKFGLDPSVMTDVLNASSGMNNSTRTKLKQFVLSRSFGSGFSAALMLKDLKTALALAEDLGVAAPFSAECRDLWESGVSALEPGADHTAIARACEESAGLSLAADGSAAPSHQQAGRNK